MGQMTFQSKTILAFGGALLLLAFLGVLSYRRAWQEDADRKWVEHTHLVLEKLDSVFISLVDQEASQHGRAIDKVDSSLQPNDTESVKLRQNLAVLRTLTLDNSKQQATLDHLESLVTAWLAPDETPTQGSADSKSRLPADKASVDQIRALLLEMKQEEQGLLVQRLKRAEFGSRRIKLLIAAGYATSFLLLALAGFTINIEIGKRRETSERLQRAQEHYHLLFDSNPIPVWVYDLHTLAVLDVNAAAVRHYGYTREEFLRLKITDIRPTEDVPTMLRSVAEAPASEEDSGPWRHIKKSGEIIEVEIRSYPLLFAGKEARMAVVLDITRRKLAEEALRQSEERFRLIVSNVKDYAILMLNPEGRIISWNSGAEKIKGYLAEEIIGQHFSRFYLPEDVSAGKPAFELKVATQEGRFEEEGWRVRKDGSKFWANVVVTALRDESGHLRGFGKITRDISDRKRAELEISRRTAELETANKELEAFSYSVSHDLRAPLRGIDGFSQAVLEDYGDSLDDTGKNHLQRIRTATQRMGALIDDLLNLARVTRTEIHNEPIDLSAIANEIATDLRASEPGREVEFHIAAGLRTEGDSRLLRVALQNLIGNSWKFTSKRPHAEIEVGLLRSNGRSAYFVRDNGAGFDQAYSDRLFGAFQRLHTLSEFPGTGVGLATVQRIISRHGGKVWAEGVVDKGATIYFTL